MALAFGAGFVAGAVAVVGLIVFEAWQGYRDITDVSFD